MKPLHEHENGLREHDNKGRKMNLYLVESTGRSDVFEARDQHEAKRLFAVAAGYKHEADMEEETGQQPTVTPFAYFALTCIESALDDVKQPLEALNEQLKRIADALERLGDRETP